MTAPSCRPGHHQPACGYAVDDPDPTPEPVCATCGTSSPRCRFGAPSGVCSCWRGVPCRPAPGDPRSVAAASRYLGELLR